MAFVLIVEDEPAIQRIVSAVVRAMGHRAVASLDAETALDLVEQQHPDFVITDVRLPGMDGVQLARLLKSKHASLPVLIMSAYGEPRDHPGDGFLPKPFDIDTLEQAVTGLV